MQRVARIGLILFGALAYCAVLSFILTFGRIPSRSPDMAFHLQLLEVVRSHWIVPADSRAFLAEMYGYPRFSHRVAAIASRLGLSNLNALTLSGAGAAAVAWLCVLYQARRVSLQVLFGGVIATGALAVLTRGVIGFEIVDNYCYPQLVAEAVVMVGLSVGVLVVRRGPVVFAACVGGLVFFCGYLHLVGALKLAGALCVLAALNGGREWLAAGGRPRLLWLLSPAVAGVAILAHPSFASMRSLSKVDGALAFAYPFTPWQLALVALITAALAGGVASTWLMRSRRAASGVDLAPVDLFVSLGLATAAVFFAQYLALAVLGEGSPYAVKKHAYGLFTALAFLAPLAVWTWRWREDREKASISLKTLALVVVALQVGVTLALLTPTIDFGVPAEGRAIGQVRAVLLGLAIAAPLWAWIVAHRRGGDSGLRALPGLSLAVIAAHLLVMHTLYARPSQLDVARVSNLLEHMRSIRPTADGGGEDYLFASSQSPPVVGFVANLAMLRAGRDPNINVHSVATVGEAIDPARARVLVTEVGDPTYDIAHCRLAAPSGPVVTLNGQCVKRRAVVYATGGDGVAGLRSGWSADARAAWIGAGPAVVDLPVPVEVARSEGRPRLLLSLFGEISSEHPSIRMEARADGGEWRGVTFNGQTPANMFLVLPLDRRTLERGHARVTLWIEQPAAPVPRVGLASITPLP